MSAPLPSDAAAERHDGAAVADAHSFSDPPRGRDSLGRVYQAGDIISQKYRLTRVLGEGGMGAVWLARNLKLEVDVAIKLIRHELATAETAERLLQEAQAAACIEHRSIVRIFDFGETELDDPFIVMEVLTGESLRTLLERKGRRLPAASAVRTLLPIASALVEAHGNGVVHRDLKPENVMLVPDKSGGVVPKLVDFGIAKLRRVDHPGERPGALSDGGHPGERPSSSGDDAGGRGREGRSSRFITGTPDYMSPEQAGGREEVDEGADVWALAVILYETITGHVPFGGSSCVALIFAIMTAEPTPVTAEAAGDAELWEILRRALAKRPADRPTMRAFGGALAAWALARGIDSDVAGTSLAAHWIEHGAASPFSALPPPLPPPPVDLTAPVIPRAPLAPGARTPAGGSSVDTAARPDPPPPAPAAASRWASAARLLVAGVLGAATILAVSSRRQAPPAAQAAPSTASAASTVSGGGPAAAVTATASVGTSTAETTAAGSASPTPAVGTSAAPIATAAEPAEVKPATTTSLPRWAPRGGAPKGPPRKSTLPIARQPNF